MLPNPGIAVKPCELEDLEDTNDALFEPYPDDAVLEDLPMLPSKLLVS